MKIKLVRLRPEEWQRNKTIRLRALTEDPWAFGSTLAETEQLTDEDWQQRLARMDTATFVASSATGNDVGLIVGAPYDGQAGLFSMWVAPEARHQGIGGHLVDAVIGWAKTARYSQLILDVADGNTAAIALYASRGFKPNGQTGTLPPPRGHISEHQRSLRLKT